MNHITKLHIRRVLTYKALLIVFSLFFITCNDRGKQTEKESRSETILNDIQDSSNAAGDNPVSNQAMLSLTANALQVVRNPSGSTTELPVGMEMDQLLEIVSKVLATEKPEPQINTECGAGPMTMTAFDNGLVLMFQKGKSDSSKLEFVGWSLSKSRNNTKLTTMSNIGIGSTKAELASAYIVRTEKTSLGIEFSTVPDGFYGILDGPSEKSKITFMWSGLSCNFR